MRKSLKYLSLTLSATLLIACGGSGTTSTPSQQNTSMEIAIDKITNYASDTNNPAPTIDDYRNAGVTGLENIDIDRLNEEISKLDAEDVDTTEEINAIVARLGIEIKPTANAQSVTTNEDSPIQIKLSGSDIEGNILTYTITSNPEHGILSGTAPDLTYTPEENYYGEDSFTFKVNNTKEDSEETAVNITIVPVNDTPTADAGKDQTTKLNTTIMLTGTGSDIEDTVTYQWKEGDTILSDSATLNYLPTTAGVHTLTFIVTDSNGVSTTDTVKINVGDLQDYNPPAAPSGISGWNETQEGARIGWVDNSDNEDGFRIYDSQNHIVANNIPKNTIAHTLTGLECNTLYTVRVVAYNSDGESEKSDAKTFRTTSCDNSTEVTDTEKPIITLIGEPSITIMIGDTYTDAGATASDNKDGDITAKITTTGLVDTNVAGTYTIKYQVSDTSGNTAEILRTIEVLQKEGSVPVVPVNLAVSESTLTQTTARVSFLDQSNDENGFKAYTYKDNILKQTNDIPAKEGTDSYQYYTIANLECDTLYTVNIVAYNDYGESEKISKLFRTELCDNILPTAKASASPMEVELGKDITFSCTGSDEDGTIESYRWLIGHTEVAQGKTFTTNDFAVGENTYTCEVEDDRKGRGRSDVTITATSDEPTSYAIASPASIMVEDRATLECKGNPTYEGGIKGYTWYKDDIEVSSEQIYNTPTTLAAGNYTYSCKVTYNDNATAKSEVQLTVQALPEDLEKVDLSLDFEEYAVGDYDPTKTDSPLYFAPENSMELEYLKIINREDGNGKAVCIKGKYSGAEWSKTLIFNIPGLDRDHPINLAGELKLDFEYKEAKDATLNALTWINLYDRFTYFNGTKGSTVAGGHLLFNLDPGVWQKSNMDNFNYAFGIDDPQLPGDLYGIKAIDTSVAMTKLALKLSQSTNDVKEESFDVCIDNIHLSGTQMKPDVFDQEYGAAGGFKRWTEYTERIADTYTDITTDQKALKIPSCDGDLSVKQDYQCHKLAALKRFIDDKVKALDTAKTTTAGAFFTKDVQRVKDALARYKATYEMFQSPPPKDGLVAYRVPTMKYGRLDGYTFPMLYNKVEDDPYKLTMAKDEYKSIAILLDPGRDFNKELTFTNTTFSNDGGIELDKYIAPVWYQAGKDNSNSDYLEFSAYNNEEGTAWLTQELLLKNEKLIKIARDPNEKNMIFYQGKNYLYTTKKDTSNPETFRDDWGQVPGYVKISTAYNDTEFGPYDIIKLNSDNEEERKGTRYNLTPDDDNLLIFDDELTIQSFTLHDEYKLLWGIIHVDKDAAEGLHQAVIEIKDENNNIIQKIPLDITVLNYTLSESKLDYGLYYHGRYESGTPPSVQVVPGTINKTREQNNKELKDMYEHGIRYPLVELESGRAMYLMDDLHDIGYPNDKFFSWDGNVFARPETDPQKIYDLQQVMEGNDYFSNAQLYIGVKDEASTFQIADIKRYIRDVLRGDEWKDKIRVKTWGGAFKSAVELLADGGYLDAPVVSGGPSSWAIPYELEKYKQAEEDEKGNWTDAATVYKYGDPQSGVENPEIYRRNYGITMWQEGFNGGGMDYAYQKQYGFYWNDFDVAYTFEKNHREEAFTYPTTGLKEGGKGFVSTIQWEGYREAITDSRYISTLYDRAGEANKAEIDRFIQEDLDTSEGSDLDAAREKIINKISQY